MAFYLSAAEKEIIAALQLTLEITELEAVEHHLQGKRELALTYARRGNVDLAEHLLKELDEWSEEMSIELQRIAAETPKKIIIA